jgi:hypothetical protein
MRCARGTTTMLKQHQVLASTEDIVSSRPIGVDGSDAPWQKHLALFWVVGHGHSSE